METNVPNIEKSQLKVEAGLGNGVLQIGLPKPAETKQKPRKIKTC